MTKREYLSLEEAEAIYGIPAETLKKWIKRDPSVDGKPALVAFKPGKEILVNRKEFENYIKKFPAA